MNAYIKDSDTCIYEIGCGMGVSKRFLKNKNVMLTDVLDNPWVDRYLDAMKLDLEDGSVDVFICSNVIHHFASPYQFIQEARKKLKKGGRIIFFEPYTSILMRMAQKALRLEGKAAYRRNLDKAGKNRHLFQMISRMRGCYYTAVVTTASRKNAGEILEHFMCGSLFDYLVTQEDVSKKKPDPEGFLKAMGYFGMDAGHTVIFEDSDAGIAAARATGASVFVIDSF